MKALYNWMLRLQDVLSGKLPKGAKRSPEWGKVREKHLKQHPRCALCGSSQNLTVHHKKPFWLFPELELDTDNLITLCDGWRILNCHLVVGHLLSFKSFNPNVTKDVLMLRSKIKHRP